MILLVISVLTSGKIIQGELHFFFVFGRIRAVNSLSPVIDSLE